MVDLIRSLATAISGAQRRDAPFLHAVIDSIFPEELYDRLIAEWPVAAAWRPISDYGGGNYKDRVAIDLMDDGRLALLPGNMRALWEQVRDALTSEPVKAALLRLFAPAVKRQMRQLVPEGPVQMGSTLLAYQDKDLYALGPHTDTPKKLVTGLFYLPRTDEDRHAGTSLYVPKDPTFTCKGGPHYAFDMFNRVDTISYTRNRLLAFACSNISFHGVERLRGLSEPRRLINLDLRVAT